MPKTKLTKAQRETLDWASGQHDCVWINGRGVSPPKNAVLALVRRGLLQRVGHPNDDRYKITEAGRAARAALA